MHPLHTHTFKVIHSAFQVIFRRTFQFIKIVVPIDEHCAGQGRAHTHTHTHAHTHARTHTRTHTHAHAHEHARTHTNELNLHAPHSLGHRCVCVRVCARTYTHTTGIHTHATTHFLSHSLTLNLTDPLSL